MGSTDSELDVAAEAALVLDSSAIVAIHFKEPGYLRLIEAIEHAGVVAVGAPTLLETSMVLTARVDIAHA
jgi:uncharacterized protein with PIN domain